MVLHLAALGETVGIMQQHFCIVVLILRFVGVRETTVVHSEYDYLLIKRFEHLTFMQHFKLKK